MPITYDFDMFSVLPKGIEPRPGEQRALFRDPAAVAALQGASNEVKSCLWDGGFGFNVHDSGAGPGRYPALDGPARAAVIERLMENLEKLPEGADWNGFDIEAFAMAALTAKPMETAAAASGALPAAERGVAPTPEAAPASAMDDFFSGTPKAAEAAPRAPAPNMDDFFSGSPRAAGPAPEQAAPDMDAFFSNTGGGRARADAPPPQMTADDIRLSVDTAPPKKVGFGPVKMAVMALGLFAVVSLLGNGIGAEKLVEVATGGKMVSIGQ